MLRPELCSRAYRWPSLFSDLYEKHTYLDEKIQPVHARATV